MIAMGPFFNYLRLASAILLPLSTRRTRVTTTAFKRNNLVGGRPSFSPYSCRSHNSCPIRRYYTTTTTPSSSVVTPAGDDDDDDIKRDPSTPTSSLRADMHPSSPTTSGAIGTLRSSDHSLQNGSLKYRLRRTVVYLEGGEEEGDNTTTTTTSSSSSSSSSSSRSSIDYNTATDESTHYTPVLQYNPLTGVVTGQYRDTDHIEMLGLLGYDFIWADAEHSSASPDDVGRIILAAERRGIPTLVRVGYGYQNIIGHIQKYLVAGAQGILLPQCECREDVIRLVDAVKFPPIGKRGLAGERWNAWGLARRHTEEGQLGRLSLAQCVEDANRNSIIGVVIESQKGIDALEGILSVPELDFVFIAPTDLSSDMGLHGQIRHPKVLAKIEEAGKIISDTNLKRHRSGRGNSSNEYVGTIAAGTLAITPEDYMYWRERNFPVLCGVAQCMFVDGAKTFLDKIHDYEQHRNGGKHASTN